MSKAKESAELFFLRLVDDGFLPVRVFAQIHFLQAPVTSG